MAGLEEREREDMNYSPSKCPLCRQAILGRLSPTPSPLEGWGRREMALFFFFVILHTWTHQNMSRLHNHWYIFPWFLFGDWIGCMHACMESKILSSHDTLFIARRIIGENGTFASDQPMSLLFVFPSFHLHIHLKIVSPYIEAHPPSRLCTDASGRNSSSGPEFAPSRCSSSA